MPISVSIVEDNDKLRGTLARVLNRGDGFHCASQYANAEDALKDLPQVRPEVVLMDINLPGMNGVECVRQLKALLPDHLKLRPALFAGRSEGGVRFPPHGHPSPACGVKESGE